eukprot:scaffold1766_cov401-Prasinococcus_capsulatus_cf.AAC.25
MSETEQPLDSAMPGSIDVAARIGSPAITYLQVMRVFDSCTIAMSFGERPCDDADALVLQWALLCL